MNFIQLKLVVFKNLWWIEQYVILVFNDGSEKHLLNLDGVIPVHYRGELPQTKTFD